jgi:gamma-glutamyltranspeptidase / glutathione hydrolase
MSMGSWLRPVAVLAAAYPLSCTHASSEPPGDGGSGEGAAACEPGPSALAVVERQMKSKRGTMGRAPTAMVATSHATATQMGIDTLARGGSAVDAYIAATLTEDLVLPGVTSTAGIAGFLVYDAGTTKIYYFHGPFQAPSVGATPGAGAGAEVLLPGAVAALALGSQYFGKLPLVDVVSPVATLAGEGFRVDAIYAASIRANQALLEGSEYGKKTFFAGGGPLAEGDLLAQPEVQATLDGIASSGSGYFYTGAWANAFVTAVTSTGGTASLADLAEYRAMVDWPLVETYRGADLVTSSGYSYGGATLLLALKTLEHANLVELGRFDASPASLELLIRTHDAESSQESWLQDPTVLLDPGTAYEDIEAGAETLWGMVQSSVPLADAIDGGTHSSAVVVVDAAGNIAVGTHTINTTNWGLGLFAGGLPLATVASLHPGLAPGAYATDPLSSEIAFVDGQPRVAMSTYGDGLHPGDVQVLSYMLDFGLDPEDAVLTPRLGNYGYVLQTQNGMTTFTSDPTTHLLDERVPASVVCPVRAAGFELKQSQPPGYPPGVIDTGFPTVVTLDTAPGPSHLKGMTPEWMSGVAAGF